jgi:hypothetical protein
MEELSLYSTPPLSVIGDCWARETALASRSIANAPHARLELSLAAFVARIISLVDNESATSL